MNYWQSYSYTNDVLVLVTGYCVNVVLLNSELTVLWHEVILGYNFENIIKLVKKWMVKRILTENQN